MCISQVISGGQTGVDIAALRSAVAVGLPTGGTMPKGFRTLAGARPEYAGLYRMTESHSSEYGPRTDKNAKDADFTLRVAENFMSAGEQRTLRAIGKRPEASIKLTRCQGGRVLVASDADVKRAVAGMKALAAKLGRGLVLNVAGNSERTCPGIEVYAQGLLTDIFSTLLKG